MQQHTTEPAAIALAGGRIEVPLELAADERSVHAKDTSRLGDGDVFAVKFCHCNHPDKCSADNGTVSNFHAFFRLKTDSLRVLTCPSYDAHSEQGESGDEGTINPYTCGSAVEETMDSLRDVLDHDYAVLRGLNERAVHQFRLTLTRWSEHLGRQPEVSDLTGITVQKFLQARRDQVSIATVVKDRTHIVALWNHLFRLRRVDAAPAAVLPPLRAPKRVPRAYRAEEVSALIRAALTMPGGIDGRPASIWHASLIRAALETAERIGALMAVEWRDVDFRDQTILLRAENRKGCRQDLLRPISQETCRWIATLRLDGGERRKVWGWPASRATLWNHLRRICQQAGVQNRGYHGLRRTAASYIAAAGGLGEAAAALGHSSPDITRSHYVDVTIAKPTRTHLSMLPELDLSPRDADGERRLE